MQDAFDLSLAEVHNSPDPSTWPITTALTRLDVRVDGVQVAFDAKNRWPEVVPPGWSGGIQYTLWLGLHIDGKWHIAGIIEYWKDLDASGGNIIANDQIAVNWTYDCGVMARQPITGDPVAFFVTAGDQRKKDVFEKHERSQVVVIPFPARVPATFTFTSQAPPLPDPGTPPPQPAPDLFSVMARLDVIESKLTKLAVVLSA